MAKFLIAANWKLHCNPDEASSLLEKLDARIQTNRQVEVAIGPTMLSLYWLSRQIDKRKFKLIAQDAYHQDEGAFTGETSFAMLKGIVKYAIVGHSERRYKFGENLDTIRDKLTAAIRNKITPILCVGETQTEQANGETARVLHDQVTTAVSNLVANEIEKLVIAYEPVWALSDGHNFKTVKTPTPTQIKAAGKVIRGSS